MTQLQVWTSRHKTTWPADREITFGRSSSSDVRSTNPLVSRYHALARHDRTGWVLHDASSRGTYLNGRRVDRVDVRGPMQVHFGDPDNGEAVRLMPVTTGADRSRTAPAMSASVRLVVSGVIVLTAGFITTTLLRHVFTGQQDILANLGFTWATFFMTVDDLLERKRVSLRLRRWGRAPTNEAAPALADYRIVAYSIGLLVGGIQLGGFIGGVVYYAARPTGAGGEGWIYLSAIVAGCVTLFVIGTWFGRRYGRSGRRLLLIVAVSGAVLDALLDTVVWGGGVGPVELAAYVLLWAPLWALLAWAVGVVGMRRTQAPATVQPVSP